MGMKAGVAMLTLGLFATADHAAAAGLDGAPGTAGEVLYRNGKPAGLIAGGEGARFSLQRLVLVNAAGWQRRRTNGGDARAEAHVSGVGLTYAYSIIPFLEGNGVQVVHVTPDHPQFAVRWALPQWMGAVGVQVNPLPWRALGRIYDPLVAETAPSCHTAVHIAEPALSTASTAMLGRRGAVTTALHTDFATFARQAAPDSGVGRMVRGLEALGRAVPRSRGRSWTFEEEVFAWLRRAHRHSERILTRSPAMIDLLCEKGFAAERLHLWPGHARAISDEQLAQPKSDEPFFRAMRTAVAGPEAPVLPEQRFAQGKIPRPILLYWGRLSPEKGVDLVLGLQAHRQPLVPHGASGEPTIFIIGGGSTAYEAELARLNRELGGRAIFLGVRMDPEKTELIRAADVAVLPSLGETFGLTRVEAIANGLPVVGLADRGFEEIVGPGGVVAAEASAEAVAVAVLQAQQLDPRAGLIYAREHWSEERSRLAFLEGLVPFVRAPAGKAR